MWFEWGESDGLEVRGLSGIIAGGLKEFYTLSDPDAALKDIARLDAAGNPAAFVTTLKMERFQSYLTEDAFLVFLVMPEWLSIYSQAALQGLSYTPEEIKLTKTGDGQYKFSLMLVVSAVEGGTSEKLPQSGTLTANADGKIEDFEYDNLGEIQTLFEKS